MLVNAPSVEAFERICRQMGLPEPFVWGHVEGGVLTGLITGWIHDGVIEADHVILLPTCRRRVPTMLTMVRQATEAVHERGLDAVMRIVKADARASGLHAWATRLGYAWYAEDAEVDWYVHHARPAQRGDRPAGHTVVAPPLPIVAVAPAQARTGGA